MRADELGIGLAVTATFWAATKFGPPLLAGAYAVVVWLAKLVRLLLRRVWRLVPVAWRKEFGVTVRAVRDNLGAATRWLAGVLRPVFCWFLDPGEVRAHLAQGVDGMLWVVVGALAALVRGLAELVRVLADLLRRVAAWRDAVLRAQARVRDWGCPAVAVVTAGTSECGGGQGVVARAAAAAVAAVAAAAVALAEAAEALEAKVAEATQTWEWAGGAEAWEWAAAVGAEEEAVGGW